MAETSALTGPGEVLGVGFKEIEVFLAQGLLLTPIAGYGVGLLP